ncbi:16S rRNA (uracil(1498)-N(3))-methyltransferase [Ktedonosporobacter rubrisoli]|uniref:Ribosomal RNA small subunit methyltransferase E n=1 Tax=Ktedonosporobacter rubrisoli TaxID=2509675 RepID=A0A4P6K1L8_KTERU|nr:16S rRNA (uracil(1498)-N(3))-methyltransferase [Ktedonosporobacter rubrisoli]QBD81366.1 16S rRNA (uracil(1498)-N(3))-methyltransferase [Ktedonosporobacter rubrisoli]
MHRFFVTPEILRGATSDSAIELPDKLAHQVRDVLRVALDEQLVLLDNSGKEALCAVSRSSRAGVEVRLLEWREGKREPVTHVILCQGLLKSARFEWILEKGTELGVSTFAPILCRRSTAGLEEAGSSKLQRWQRIIQEAAEQCGRSRLPELAPILPFGQALKNIPDEAIALIPWEEEHGQSLRIVLQDVSAAASLTPAQVPTVVLFIGPEGGLTAEEIAQARQACVTPVTLGARILRAETAALTAVANVMYALEA